MGRSGFRKAAETAVLGVFLALLFSFAAFAADGWHSRNGKIWYTTTSETGERTRARGLTKIGNYTYYFDRSGYLKTGWRKSRYFRRTGKPGVRGRMYREGIHKVLKKGPYGFAADGTLLTGLHQVGGSWYYFSESRKAGERGLMVKRAERKTSDGRTIWLLKNGKMAVNRWVKYRKQWRYYGADGNLYRSTVTPDGWTVNGQGVRTKKASSGQTTGGTASVLRAAGTKASTGKASILILCGHGQGDSGAVGKWKGSWIQEQAYTRDFGARIFRALQSSGRVDVDLFDISLDTYQQMRDTLNNVTVKGKTLQSRITGSGQYAQQTYSAVRGNSRLNDPLKYDYVLEVHFDASAASGKDYSGDGRIKGTFMYINAKKKTAARTIDAEIISALHEAGLPVCGPSVWTSPGLLNARVYQEMGVSYGLLETCFIDDHDDMAFYMKHRDEMASAVSDAIVRHFS